MSTKSLRLVLEERERTKAKTDRDDECGPEESTGFKKNIFELLNDESENEENQTEEMHDVQEISSKKKNKRKNKKKKSKEITNSNITKDEKNNEEEDEDIDSLIKEVNEITAGCASSKVSQHISSAFKSCFTVELRHLNPDNEIKKLFGNRVLLNEKKNKRQRNVKKYQLITPKVNVEVVLRKSGLSMDLVRRRSKCTEFVFVHSKSYQEAQKSFMQTVQSNNHEELIKLIERYPFHIDALQQMSDLYRMQEDLQQAAEFIEHALYVFEASFHPLFSLTTGCSVLDYRRRENRAFFLVLFRHMCFLSNKSLHRTALEVAKLILSLNAESDPLGVLLLLDHLAIKADQHLFLTRLYDEWHASKNLCQLPNFAFSTPLAHFLISSSPASSEASRPADGVCKHEALLTADKMLQEALLMYPCMLLRLLEKLSVRPDASVLAHAHFNQPFYDEPKALCMLMDLYIWRSGEVWKGQGVMEWVERNVREMLQAWDGLKDTAECYRKARMARYKGTPRNIYRHIIISEARSVISDIPQFLLSSVDGYDPLPPTNSIQAYDSTPSDNRTRATNSSFLSLFFQSLSPTFTHNDASRGGNEEGEGNPGLVEQVRQVLRNRFNTDYGIFQRLQRSGDDDDADDGDDDDDAEGGDNDGDVPIRQNWDDADDDGDGVGSISGGGEDGVGGSSGGNNANGRNGDGVRRRIVGSVTTENKDERSGDSNTVNNDNVEGSVAHDS